MQRFALAADGVAGFEKFPVFAGIAKARLAQLGQPPRPRLVFIAPTEEALGLISADKDGKLSIPRAFDPGVKPLVFDIGELNGDGFPDLVLGVKDKQAPLRYYAGTAAGDFQSSPAVTLKL